MEKISSYVPIRHFLFDIDNNNPSAISQRRRDSTAKAGQKASDYMQMYFVFQFLHCVSPFRIIGTTPEERQEDPEVPLYTTKKYFPQQCVCVIIGMAACVGIVGELRLALPKDSSNPVLYFQMAQTFAFSFGKFLLLKRYWLDQHRYLNLLNLIMSTELGTLANPSIVRWLLCSNYSFFTACMAYWINEVGYYVLGLDAGTADRSKVKITMWQQMLIDARFNFLFQPKENQTFNATAELETGDYILGGLACLNYFQRIILGAFDNMYTLGAILTMWTVGTSFIQLLEEELGFGSPEPLEAPEPEPFIIKVKPMNNNEMGIYGGVLPWWPTFFERYMHLKKCADEVNRLFGINVSMVIIETIVFFAIALQNLFVQLNGNPDIFGALRCVIAIVVCCVVCSCCILSADVARKMERVRIWLSRPEIRDRTPEHEYQFVMDDLYFNNTSVKASNTYPITYNMLANLAGTTATYFLICVQIS